MGFFDWLLGGASSKQAFGEAVIAHLRERGETRTLTLDQAQNRIVVGEPGGQPVAVLSLANAWEEFSALPKDQRHRVIERFAAPALLDVSSFSNLEAMKGSLLPRVRDRLYPNLLALRMRQQLGPGLDVGKTQPELPHRPLADWLAVSLCIDLPTSIADCLGHHFTDWKASFDELFPIALGNLRARSQQPFVRVAPGVYVSPFRDSHDPARLLLSELFASFELKGAPVAGVPNRDTLIVTGADDEAGLSEFVTLMKMGLKEPRPVSSAPLVLGEGGWSMFDPAFEGPLAAELRLLAAQVPIEHHAQQKEALEAEFARLEREVFVATYTAFRSPEGRVRTFGTWARGVPTLLPKTDELMLTVMPEDGQGEPVVTRATWDSVTRVCGHRLVREPGLWPERWLATSFPSDDELAAIAAGGPGP
ncbi:MAG: hypothetical protein MUC96_37905 [Myxococcaceae bacterium]|jgi:hypothetical protein|nr:hypothetical protein [Myxococcaceae bacterium]